MQVEPSIQVFTPGYSEEDDPTWLDIFLFVVVGSASAILSKCRK